MRIMHRLGLTLLEMLVILGIILLLLVLITPALLQMKELARIKRCQNNLKQIAMALQHYHDTHMLFPPGITAWNLGSGKHCENVALSSTCDYPPYSNVSGFALLLLFMAEKQSQQAYAAYNMNLACCAGENPTTVATHIPDFLCPTNNRASRSVISNYYLPLAGVRRARNLMPCPN